MSITGLYLTAKHTNTQQQPKPTQTSLANVLKFHLPLFVLLLWS